MRWTRGPLDQRSRTWINWDLSGLISIAHLTSYNGWDLLRLMKPPINQDRTMKIWWQIWNDSPLHSIDVEASEAFTNDRTIINRRQRFTKGCVIVTVDREASLHRTVAPNFYLFKCCSSRRKKAPVKFQEIWTV